MELTTGEQQLASAYEYFFKGDKICHQFSNKQNRVNLVTHQNDLAINLNTITTIGLTSNLGHELIAIAYNLYDQVGPLMANIALQLLNQKSPLEEGDILTDILTVDKKSELQHVLIMRPFLWPHHFDPIQLRLLVPITNTEWEFANNYGVDRLIELFSIYDVDLADWQRKSVEISELF